MDFLKDFFSALWNDISSVWAETIPLGDNPITTLNIVVWSLYIGFMIGIGVTVYNRIVLGGLIRRMLEHQATDEKSAVTIAEVGCTSPFIKLALRKGGTFRNIVHMVGDTPENRNPQNLATARFFIPDENIHRAEIVYGNNGANAMSIALAILAFFVVMLLAFIIVPNLIQMLNNFIAAIQPESKFV